MSDAATSPIQGLVVEEQAHLTLAELCRVCQAGEEQVVSWVVEGVLEPVGRQPHEWRFAGESLRRAQRARRLARDLQVNAAGIALALDLLDEIESLRAQLRGR